MCQYDSIAAMHSQPPSAAAASSCAREAAAASRACLCSSSCSSRLACAERTPCVDIVPTTPLGSIRLRRCYPLLMHLHCKCIAVCRLQDHEAMQELRMMMPGANLQCLHCSQVFGAMGFVLQTVCRRLRRQLQRPQRIVLRLFRLARRRLCSLRLQPCPQQLLLRCACSLLRLLCSTKAA
jgi:hypothetical protein